MWEKVIEKAINVKVKINLQSLLGIKKIDFGYQKGYRLAKKYKDEAN